MSQRPAKRIAGHPEQELIGSAICNGGFGEVLQGVRESNQKFLVNLKIKNYSRATVYVSKSAYRTLNEHRYWKSYRLVKNLLKHLGYDYNCHVDIQSNIPIGKGLSSSTADMVASVRALENALSISIENDFLSRAITDIEPNDGLHYPGTSFYEHTEGRLIYNFPFIPRLKIVGVDFGGEVDTLTFNRSDRRYGPDDGSVFDKLLESLAESYRKQDVPRILEIATKSGMLSQKVLYKPYFESFLDFSKTCSAQGVINTHSGTYLGMVFDREIPEYPEICRRINRRFENVEIDLFETVGF